MMIGKVKQIRVARGPKGGCEMTVVLEIQDNKINWSTTQHANMISAANYLLKQYDTALT